ncbi:hypothetical protein LJC32_05400 [Oscillospiraceae bacterium OttesenSCG-928-F05]|nr:hypothetical protein [Oscillospiraceae bacterium OttesenSCG-928-F05]
MDQGLFLKSVKKNANVLLVIASAVFLFYLWYAIGALPYLLGAFSSGVPVDTEKLFAASEPIVLSADMDVPFRALEDWETPAQYKRLVSVNSAGVATYETQAEPFVEGYVAERPPRLYPREVFFDGLRYRFTMTIEDVKELGVGYYMDADTYALYRVEGPPLAAAYPEGTVQRAVLLTVEGRQMLALLHTGLTYAPGDTITHAVFAQVPPYLLYDIKDLPELQGMAVLGLELDQRSLPVNDEGMDFILWILATLLLPAFFVYGILCRVDLRKHPSYRLLNRQTDAETCIREMDEELPLEGTYEENGAVYMKTWILEPGFFITRVKRNHMLRH